MSLQESGEMYLETIYILSQKNRNVRAIDIGEYMGYSKPSVSRALGILKKGAYITVDVDGHITLTESGYKVAAAIYERHTVLSEILMHLGVDAETAVADACRIEHVISAQSFKALQDHIHKFLPADFSEKEEVDQQTIYNIVVNSQTIKEKNESDVSLRFP